MFLLFIGRDALINSSSYATARIDVSEKTANAAPCFRLIDKNTGKELSQAGWMPKWGNRGYVMQKNGNSADLQINVIADNCKIDISLKGPWELKDKNDRSKGIKEHWVEYTKFTVNGKNLIFPKFNEDKTVNITYYTKNTAVNADGTEKANLEYETDISLIPEPYVEPLLVYGACMRLKANPQHVKFSYWYGMYKENLADMKSQISISAKDVPFIKMHRR